MTWTKEEEDRLKELAKSHSTRELLGFFPGKTYDMLSYRLKKHGLTVKKAHTRYKFWTIEDLNYLVLNFKKMPTKKIAKTLGRSANSTFKKAKQLGLTDEKQLTIWTQEEETFLRNKLGVLSTEKLCEQLGRTKHSIYQKAKQWGMSTQLENITWRHIDAFFNCEKTLVSQHSYNQWHDNGLVTITQGKSKVRYIATLHQLRAFLKRKPEALEIYDVCDETLEELNIDIDEWPEPPIYKVISCTGKGKKKHRVVKNKILLYEKKPRCSKCGFFLPYWGESYSNK